MRATIAPNKLTRRQIKIVLFDGDDTLWSTQPIYDEATRRFADLMVAEGFSRRKALEVLAWVDVRNVAKFGFNRKRYPRSLAESYAELARSVGERRKRRTLRRLKHVAAAVFAKTPQLVPGVLELLRSLRGKVRKILVTAGDPSVQRSKLRKLGLAQYFDEVYIPRLKTEGEFLRILGREGVAGAEACLIGNSARSDVLPALAAGMQVIWLRRGQWEYDRVRIRSRRVLRATGMEQVKEMVADLLKKHRGADDR